MSGYAGIELIDSTERLKHHELTKALWQKLREMDIKTGDKGRIKGVLISNSYEQAKTLKKNFQGDDFDATIYNQGDSTQIIQITTPLCKLSIEALLEITDLLLISVVNTDIKFDGLEIDVNEVKKLNAPWWKFW